MTALQPAAPSTGNRRRSRYLVLRGGRLSARAERRGLVVVVVMLVVAAGLAAVAMTLGDYPVAVAELIPALRLEVADPLAAFFVRDVRAPRVLAALAVGAALGLSGAVFQSLSRNPLGSPDVIGFTVGSATGALLQILVAGATPDGVAAGALAGGFATAAVVYLLSFQGGTSGSRLVLVGVGVSSVLQAANAVLVVKADLSEAQTAAVWLAGSLNAMTWSRLGLVAVGLALCAPVVVALSRSLSVMSMGDSVAAALGVRTEAVRRALLVAGVGLVAVATAAAGPVAFVALAAPQVARRITRTGGVGAVGAAAMGAVLVLASDIFAQRAFAPTQLPVGVVTGVLGGVYLVWLLSARWRGNRV